MFEKEAEEKLSEEEYKLAEEVIKPIYHNAIKNDYSFAKYGVECYLTGYNKANEWHYVKDGDLPKEDDVYLIYTTRGVLLGHYEQGGADGETDFTGEPYSDFTEYPSEMLFTEDEIIAWKEIVLPELKESE